MIPTTQSKEYFGHFYRIWKVGDSIEERLGFWNQRKAYQHITAEQPNQETLDECENLHLQVAGILDSDGNEIADAKYPNPYQIYTEKYYWDNGVGGDLDGRLRYFKSRFSEWANVNITESRCPTKQLLDFELWFIFDGDELEIDPEIQIC